MELVESPSTAPLPGAGPRLRKLLEALASPRWMLAFFAFAAIAGLVAVHRPQWITVAWLLPLSVFAMSVLAAVAVRPRLRRDPALLGLHLALLVLIALVGAARLSYFDGATTVTSGTAFDGTLQVDARGPWHHDRIRGLRFANEGLVEDYGDRHRWRATYNRVRWWDDRGVSGIAEIGDDRPLLLGGYRIFPTFNRGYAPVFHWQPKRGEAELGAVQLPPGEGFGMANDWHLLAGPDVWVMLESEAPLQIRRGERRVDLGAAELPHRLVLRSGERRELVQMGDSVVLPEGTLTYVQLRSWMGYRIVYDFAADWLAATAAVAIVCLLAFYLRLFLGRRGADGASGAAR